MIDFNVPLYIGKETDYMKEAIENKKICGDGMFTKKCNQWIEEKTGTKKALLTTSCTHATELAALLADIKEGDEVIMPAYTFVSTADAFVLRGAKAVFVDIRPDTMNIDENLIEDAITEKTRAIVPVHYAGVSCEMDKIMEIAKKHRASCLNIREKHLEPSVIMAVSVSMKQRTTAWAKVVHCLSVMKKMWKMQRLCVKREQTEASSSADRSTNIPG